MAGDSAAQIASQQNRAENGRAREYIDGNTKKLNDSERHSEAQGNSQLVERLNHRRRGHQVHGSIQQHEENTQTAYDVPRPDSRG